jgi:DNA-directed RNA polymerase I, II, and III subunit RPABC1
MSTILQIQNLFKSYKTILELLTDRGYMIPDEIHEVNLETFIIMYNNKNIDLLINNAEGDDHMYVKFFTDNSGFRKKNLLDLCEKVQEITDISVRLIIVFMNNKLPTNATKKDLTNNIFRSIELFPMKVLLFNITKNRLVPKHRLITPDEVKRVLEHYNCTINQLPKIKITDPVVKYYGFKIGNVCEIKRHSLITGDSIYYRLVEV